MTRDEAIELVASTIERAVTTAERAETPDWDTHGLDRWEKGDLRRALSVLCGGDEP